MALSLILATSTTPIEAIQQIALDERPRIDYLDLQVRLEADLIDFGVYEHVPYKWLEHPDRFSRLAWGQALYAIRHWRDYDVVYSLSEDAGVALEFLLRARGLHTPRHNMVTHNILSPRKIPLIRSMRVMNRFERIITFSSAAVGGIVETYCLEPDKVTFTMDAVDDHFWRPDKGIEAEPDYVLSIGRARRDYPTLFSAVHNLPLRLRIQGDSQWHVATADNLAATGRLPGNVELGDYLSFKDLRILFNRAAFVVITLERGAHHSAGTVSIKEAMAMGKAVIVASDGGAEDYIHPGENGLLVPAGDPNSLCQAIKELLANPTRAKEMGQRGRARLKRSMSYDAKIDWLASLAD